MNTSRRIKLPVFMALVVMIALIFLPISQVLADNVQNDVATVGGLKLVTITAGDATGATVSYNIHETGGDNTDSNGQGNRCNPADGSSATVTPQGMPNGVTTIPTAVTFTNCTSANGITFTAGFATPPGDYSISVDVSDAEAVSGDYNTAPATFTLRVKAAPMPSDTTSPVISYTVNGIYPQAPDGLNGWFVSDAVVDWTVNDPESSFTTVGCEDTTLDSDTTATGTTLSCSATSAGGTTGPVSVTIKRDATPPSIAVGLDRLPAFSSWFNEVTGAPVAIFSCSDSTSGIASCPADYPFPSGANQSHSDTAFDNAGNSASASVSSVYVDLVDPAVTWFDVQNFYYGFSPATPPSCQATDDLSGPGDCSVAGYDAAAAVGAHNLTATAHDQAGNEATDTASYTVLAWTLKGFYQPVDMNGVFNIVKGGSTVPLKFEVFAGSTKLTATSVVKSFVQTKIACETSATFDDIGVTTTGGTSLRYDVTAGQFIQNWQTPKQPGACYRVTMTTQDASVLSALFKLK